MGKILPNLSNLDKEELELAKLRLEVKNLMSPLGPTLQALSPAAVLVVAAMGWMFDRTLQRDKDANDLFYVCVGNLGSNDATTRGSSAKRLVELSYGDHVKTGQAAWAIVGRLVLETDDQSQFLETDSLTRIGVPALEPLLVANRFASLRFARAYGRAFKNRFGQLNIKDPEQIAFDQSLRSNLRAHSILDELAPSTDWDPQFRLWDLALSGSRRIAFKTGMKQSESDRPPNSKQNIKSLTSEFDISGRAMFLTGIALSELLSSLSTKKYAYNLDLHDSIVVCHDMTGIKFDSCNLSGSCWLGNITGAEFRGGSSIKGAMWRHLIIDDVKFQPYIADIATQLYKPNSSKVLPEFNGWKPQNWPPSRRLAPTSRFSPDQFIEPVEKADDEIQGVSGNPYGSPIYTRWLSLMIAEHARNVAPKGTLSKRLGEGHKEFASTARHEVLVGTDDKPLSLP